ncbi:MAG: glutamate 5-kinase [Phycisphaerae bacterium]|nr:glutamate 5-kinase [Phycisphaerae bacterium]
MPSTEHRRQLVLKARKIVIKIGTNVLTDPRGELDRRLIHSLARQIARLHEKGLRVTVVSSGSIGAGMGVMGLARRPTSLPHLQAAASVGQPALLRLFEEGFRKHKLHAAQMLLTRSDFEDRVRYLNIRNTIAALHELSAIPIINENDTVAVDEIRYGDNDIIAALTANLIRADLLVILTVVDGLMDAAGKRLDCVQRVDKEISALARATKSSLGSGGMASKLQAIRRVTEAGDYAVIANGRMRGVLTRLMAGQKVGTLFMTAPNKVSSRKRWIGWSVRPRGAIVVDEGAALALRRGGKSLLAIGVTAIKGQFERGDVVRVHDAKGTEFARGLSNYGVADLSRIKGMRSNQFASVLGEKTYDEVIHRDNLVITEPG